MKAWLRKLLAWWSREKPEHPGIAIADRELDKAIEAFRKAVSQTTNRQES